MIIEVVASSSSGNCYIVRGARDVLLIEAGIPVTAIKKALKFNLVDVAGCLITHEHGDHAKSAGELAKLMIPIIASNGTISALKLSEKVKKHAKHGQKVTCGEFEIIPFDVQHDCMEPLGFLIKSTLLNQTIVFATDTYYLRYTFKNIDCYMIEANYSAEILVENIETGRLNAGLAERTTQSHFEINDVINFLIKTDTNKTKKIILLHPSSTNADTKDFEQRVSRMFWIDAVTAVPGPEDWGYRGEWGLVGVLATGQNKGEGGRRA